MAIKLQAMRALCFPRRHVVPSGELHEDPPSSPASFSTALMEDNLNGAEQEVHRWNSSNSPLSITRDDVRDLVLAADDLQRVMEFFAADSRSRNLVRAQKLMQSAMHHLEREFYRILSANRGLAGEVSRPGAEEDEVEGECGGGSPSAATVEALREIADTMVSAGYGRECVRAYKMVRTSVVDEGLYLLRYEPLPVAQIHRMEWEALEVKIHAWLGAAPAAVAIFAGERLLADRIFACSDSIREALFADVARAAATGFLAFPELAARAKRSPEKLFRLLDMYDAISGLWPEIASVFSYPATSAVPAQASLSLLRLAEAARGTIAELEAAIQKDADAGRKTVPGGGVHPLTRYVMNYIAFLADYEAVLEDIYAGTPLIEHPSLPDSFFDAGAPATVAAVRIAWLVLLLLCKLDGKGEAYNDVALSYLFLANNLQYVVNKVRRQGSGGGGLRELIGDEWVAQHAAKARKYAGNYERLSWGRVAATVPPAEGATDADDAARRAMEFAGALDEACRAQREWVVADSGMREEIRDAVEGMILPAYRGFWDRFRVHLRCAAGGEVLALTPEEVRERLSEFFAAPSGSDSHTTGSVPGFGFVSGSGSGSANAPSRSSYS